MPKLKSHSASKKRFKITGSGKIKMYHAGNRHRLISKTKRAKKGHQDGAYVSSANVNAIKKLLPYD